MLLTNKIKVLGKTFQASMREFFLLIFFMMIALVLGGRYEIFFYYHSSFPKAQKFSVESTLPNKERKKVNSLRFLHRFGLFS
jgi:hypothetical protein